MFFMWPNKCQTLFLQLIGASKRLPQLINSESTSGKSWMKKWINELTNCIPWLRNRSLEKQRSFEYGIVVEYVPGGTLRSHLLKNHIKKLPLNSVIQIALDIARGLSYLHSKKIVHRDVKTSNLVMDKDGRVKIIDFGVSRIESSCPLDMTAQIGTIGYMAPEVRYLILIVFFFFFIYMKEQKIEFSITYTNFIVLFCICRYLLVYHMIINVMSIVLEFACGRYIVVLFHIMEKFLLLTQVHVNTRYVFQILCYILYS